MRERSYAPTVVAGLAGAALAAVAATRDWASASGDAAGVAVETTAKGSDSAPLAATLALVALAAWGVVLVLRGRVRRLAAGLGGLAAAGVVAVALTTLGPAQHDALEALRARGAAAGSGDVSTTGWYAATLAGAAVCLAGFAVAVLRASRWPVMGSRYDAPGARAAEPVTDQDLWRALDEGHDPTA